MTADRARRAAFPAESHTKEQLLEKGHLRGGQGTGQIPPITSPKGAGLFLRTPLRSWAIVFNVTTTLVPTKTLISLVTKSQKQTKQLHVLSNMGQFFQKAGPQLSISSIFPCLVFG